MCIPAMKWKFPEKKKNLGNGPVQAKIAESNEYYSVVILPLTSVSTGERHAKSQIAHQDFSIYTVSMAQCTLIHSLSGKEYLALRKGKKNSCSTTSS